MTRTAPAETFDSAAAGSPATSHMRMSDEQYFRSCVAKERHLAQLLGHQNIEECYESAGTLWAGAQALPQWTRDWGACGPLLAQYRIAITHDPAAVPTGGGIQPANTVHAGETRVTVSDHPYPDRALMVAIVREVIRQLEHPHTARTPLPAALLPHA
jgi:hypothetical protein